jgi:hypothetical protein
MRCVFIGNFILHLIFTKLVLYAFQPEKPDPTKKVAPYRYKDTTRIIGTAND